MHSSKRKGTLTKRRTLICAVTALCIGLSVGAVAAFAHMIGHASAHHRAARAAHPAVGLVVAHHARRFGHPGVGAVHRAHAGRRLQVVHGFKPSAALGTGTQPVAHPVRAAAHRKPAATRRHAGARNFREGAATSGVTAARIACDGGCDQGGNAQGANYQGANDGGNGHQGGDQWGNGQGGNYQGGSDQGGHQGGNDQGGHQGGSDQGGHQGGSDQGGHQGGNDQGGNYQGGNDQGGHHGDRGHGNRRGDQGCDEDCAGGSQQCRNSCFASGRTRCRDQCASSDNGSQNASSNSAGTTGSSSTPSTPSSQGTASSPSNPSTPSTPRSTPTPSTPVSAPSASNPASPIGTPSTPSVRPPHAPRVSTPGVGPGSTFVGSLNVTSPNGALQVGQGAGGTTTAHPRVTGALAPGTTRLAPGSRLHRAVQVSQVNRVTAALGHHRGASQPVGTGTVIERFITSIPTGIWFALGGLLLMAAVAAVAAWRSSLVARRQTAVAAEVSAAALTDSLTGILNRRGFVDAFKRELDRARRYGRPLALAFVDVRGLKAVNDSHGHRAGDRLLKDVAAMLGESARAHDIVGRIGGDELAVLLPEQSTDGVARVVQRVRGQVASHQRALGFSTPWDLTVGVALFPEDGEDVDELLEAADRRLYQQRGIEIR